MNSFLRNLDITFRRDPSNYRPRINKWGSTKDREQKEAGTFYYIGACGRGRAAWPGGDRGAGNSAQGGAHQPGAVQLRQGGTCGPRSRALVVRLSWPPG
jgi:hypothetical protein